MHFIIYPSVIINIVNLLVSFLLSPTFLFPLPPIHSLLVTFLYASLPFYFLLPFLVSLSSVNILSPLNLLNGNHSHSNHDSPTKELSYFSGIVSFASFFPFEIFKIVFKNLKNKKIYYFYVVTKLEWDSV